MMLLNILKVVIEKAHLLSATNNIFVWFYGFFAVSMKSLRIFFAKILYIDVM